MLITAYDKLHLFYVEIPAYTTFYRGLVQVMRFYKILHKLVHKDLVPIRRICYRDARCKNLVIFLHYADGSTRAAKNVGISTLTEGFYPQFLRLSGVLKQRFFVNFETDTTIDTLLTILVSGPKYPLI